MIEDPSIYFFKIKLFLKTPIEYPIVFALTLYILSVLGLLFNRQKNIIIYMLFIELMLFSLSYLSVALSLWWGCPQGQIFALLIVCIAVAESALGLAILIVSFRTNQKIEFAGPNCKQRPK